MSGNATINSSGRTLSVSQTSNKAIIDWLGFSIGKDSSVRFDNGSGATLNRVTGDSISSLDGALTATGSVYLLNPNGVIIGKNGTVKTGGSFVASTLDVSDADFLAGGPLRFTGTSTASVVNLGQVGSLGGNVAFAAVRVVNKGAITAPNGTVGLVAGYRVTLKDSDQDGNGLFSVELGGRDTKVLNSGQILAAAAELRAEQGNVYALAGDTTGLIRATGVTNRNGKIWLTAGEGGAVTVAGSQLSASTASGDGGTISLSGGTINVAADAAFDASATTGGAGGRITAIADMANGLLVFRGVAKAAGGLSGDGGFVETSGHSVDFVSARIDTSSERGKSGLWLVDPDNLTVDASSAATISSNLATTDVTLKTTATTASGPGVSSTGVGDILVNAAVNWSSAHTLTLDSWHGIQFNANVTVGGTGGVTLLTNDGNAGGTGDYAFSLGRSLSFTGSGHLTINGDNYVLLRSMADIAGMNDPNGVSGTSYPRGGEHFALATNLAGGSISGGDQVDFFDSTFTGLGHVIDSLTINTTNQGQNTGLFGENNGTIRDLGITAVNITATGDGSWAGGIAGYNNFGSILNSYVTSGTIRAGFDAGGIAGDNAGSITNSFAGVNVQGPDGAGGIVGFNLGTVKNTYATGSSAISGTSTFGPLGGAGGIVGVNGHDSGNGLPGIVVSSYATGTATGLHTGGVVGFSGDSTPATNSYWDTQTSGLSTSVGGTGLTTAQLQGTLPSGFDANVWGTGTGFYPYLLNFGAPGQKISGFAYNASGSVAISAILNVYSGGALLGGSSATSGANGYYYIIVPTGTADGSTKLGVTETLNGQGVISGATYLDAPTLSGADIVGLDVTSGVFALHTGRAAYSTLISDASGTFGSGLFGTLNSTLNGAKLSVFASGTFAIDQSISRPGAILVQSGGALSLASTLQSAAGGDAIVLAADGAFTNTAGATALTASTGRWLIYTQAHGSATTAATGNNFGGLSGKNYYDDVFNFGTGQFAIAPGSGNRFVTGYAPVLTVTPTGESVTYNGATQSTVYGVTGYLTGTDQSADSLTGSVSGLTTGSKNVGTYHLTASGTLASDEHYRITYTNGDLTITPAALTLSATTDTKVYDGNTGSAGTVNIAGLIGGDAISGLGESFDSRNAGTRTLTVNSGYTVTDGNGGNNYSVTLQTAAGSITPAALVLSASADTRIYDGTALSSGTVSYSGLVAGDTLTGLSQQFDSRNAGSRTLSVNGGYTLADGNGGNNYTVTTQTAAGSITPAALTLNASTDTKVYDGGTSSSGTVDVVGLFGSDTVAGLGESFDSRNAGSRTLTVNGGYTVNDGNGGNNYAVTIHSTTGTITPAALVLTAATDTKVYDRSTASNGIVGISGLVGNDSVTGLTQSFDSRNAGTRTLIVNGGYIVSDGNGGGNYAVSTQSAAGSITPATLVLTTSADTKVYDGTTASSGSVGVAGLLAGDTISGLSQQFDSRNAGARTLTVDSGYVIADGNGGGNYVVTIDGASGSITPAALVLTPSGDTKVYDGSTVSGGSVGVSGLIGGDAIGGLSESFDSRNAGARTLTVNNGYTIADGNGGANYAVTLQDASGSITPASLTLTATADTKVYDGGTASSGIVDIVGLIGGDTIIGLTQSFDNRNAGARSLAVDAGYAIADGNGGGNYIVTTQGATGTITPATLILAATTDARAYDGTALSTGAVDALGLANGDSVVGLSQSFDSRNAGARMLTVDGGYTINDGNGGANYVISTQSAIGHITPATLVLTASTDAKVYDGNTASNGTVGVSGLIGGDTISGLSQQFDSRNAGTRALIVGGGYTIADGNGGANYAVTIQDATGSITPAALVLTASADGKVYDGTTASAGIVGYSGLIGGDTISGLGQGFDSRNAGTRTLNVDGGYTIADGNGGANYTVTLQSATGGITPAILTLTASADGKIYDGSTASGGTVNVSGLLGGDTISGLGQSFDSRNAGTRTLNVDGGYVIADGNGGGNYTVTTNAATGSITPASLVLTASTDTRTYDGTTASVGTVGASGLLGGDTITGLSQSFDNRDAGTRTLAVNNGYTIDDGNGGLNYTVTRVGAAGQISQRAITITADDANKFAGSPDPALTYTVTSGSFVAGESASGSLIRDAGEGPGNYAIGQGSLSVSGNYALTFVDGSLTIRPIQVEGTLSALWPDQQGFTLFEGLMPGITPDRVLIDVQRLFDVDPVLRCQDARSPGCRNAPYPTNRFVAPGIRFVPGN